MLQIISMGKMVYHFKKTGGLFNPKRSSQLQSGFIHVQVGFHLLLQGFTVKPLVQ